MTTRRKYNWPQLFTEFEQSGLSQVQFCKQHDLNPKYFNLKLSKRKAQEESGAFARVDVHPNVTPAQGLVVDVGHCKIHCPSSAAIPILVSLLKVLA